MTTTTMTMSSQCLLAAIAIVLMQKKLIRRYGACSSGVGVSHYCLCGLGTSAVGSGVCKRYCWPHHKAMMKLFGSRNSSAVADAIVDTIAVIAVGVITGFPNTILENGSANTARHSRCIGGGIA